MSDNIQIAKKVFELANAGLTIGEIEQILSDPAVETYVKQHSKANRLKSKLEDIENMIKNEEQIMLSGQPHERVAAATRAIGLKRKRGELLQRIEMTKESMND